MEHERVPVLVTEYLQALGLAGIETGRCRPPPPELLQVFSGTAQPSAKAFVPN
jgi:hypothetical protein